MTWTIAKLIDWAAGYFSEKRISSARLDAELLLSKTLRLNRVQLYTHFDRPLDESELAQFKVLLQRRAKREPLAYILGEREFFSLNFQVSPAVLIPRPETEELVEKGLEFHPSTILDLATGSGCILISLLKNLPEAQGIGVDQSSAALEIARGNGNLHGVTERAQWISHDLREAWPDSLSGPFDLITANLPYVSEAEWGSLAPELRDHEPKRALVSGVSGTEAFAWVLPQIPSRLKKGGRALLEMGAGQGGVLLEMAKKFVPKLSVEVFRDLAGRERILVMG